MIRPALITFLALALTACGFHLRNELVLPPEINKVFVKARDRYSPLRVSLENGIRRAGVQVVDRPRQKAATLEVLFERWGNTPISVDQTGRAQEHSLRYAVSFELRRPDGTRAVQRQTIELSRDYISNAANTIGTESERELLQRELRREMSTAILRRLGAILRVTEGAPMQEQTPPSHLDDPVAEEAARAALEAADALDPPEGDAPAPETPTPEAPEPATPEDPAPTTPPQTPR